MKDDGVFGKHQKAEEAKIILDGSVAAWRVEKVEMDWRQESQVSVIRQ